MPQEKMVAVDNLLQVESREVRVLSADETAQVGGAFILICTLMTDTSSDTSTASDTPYTTAMCILV